MKTFAPLVFSEQSPPFLWEKFDPRSFSRILPRGGGGSIMVAGLKCLKLMQFQRNFHFKGLKLPHKMITKSMQAQNSITNS